MYIKNEAQLKKFLMKKCVEAVSSAENKVHEEFANNLNRFYSEFNPEEYIRTGALSDSLRSTGVVQIGDSVEAEVGFDTPSYEKGWIPLQSGGYGLAAWSDEKILAVAMNGALPHGGYERGTAIWAESMKNLGGRNGIKNLIKQELKKRGL